MLIIIFEFIIFITDELLASLQLQNFCFKGCNILLITFVTTMSDVKTKMAAKVKNLLI